MNRNRKRFPVLLAILLPLLAGCTEDNLAVVGLNIEIRDARTGAPAAYDATVIVRDGAYVDTVQGWEMWAGIPPGEKAEMAFLEAAENRAGTYDVTITHPKYRTWHREGIRVVEDGKNPFEGGSLVRTTWVLAELEPLEGS